MEEVCFMRAKPIRPTEKPRRVNYPSDIKPVELGLRSRNTSSIEWIKPLGNGGVGSVFLVHVDGHLRALKLFTEPLTSELFPQKKVEPQELLWIEALHHALAAKGNDRIPQLHEWGALNVDNLDHTQKALRQMGSDIELGTNPSPLCYMLMDYLEGISVQKLGVFLNERGRRPKDEAVLAYLYCQLKIIKGLQDREIFHGDLKPENAIFLDNGDLYDIDFGTAWYKNGEITTLQMLLPPDLLAASSKTVALEQLEREVKNTTDVWGAALSALFFGYRTTPFTPDFDPENLEEIENNLRTMTKLEIEYGLRAMGVGSKELSPQRADEIVGLFLEILSSKPVVDVVLSLLETKFKDEIAKGCCHPSILVKAALADDRGTSNLEEGLIDITNEEPKPKKIRKRRPTAEEIDKIREQVTTSFQKDYGTNAPENKEGNGSVITGIQNILRQKNGK